MPKPFNITIQDVEFQVSPLPQPSNDDRNWVVVHPAAIKPHAEHDDQLLDPRGFSELRISPVAVASGTDPEGVLNEQQAETARNLAYLVTQRLSSKDWKSRNVVAQRYLPGQEEPHAFDLNQSPVAYVSFPKDKANDVEIAKVVLKELEQIKRFPRPLLELAEQNAENNAPRVTGTIKPKKSVPPTPEARIMEDLAKLVETSAPNCPPEEKIALVAALTRRELDNLTALGEELQKTYKVLPPAKPQSR